jgi:hypothetical protein
MESYVVDHHELYEAEAKVNEKLSPIKLSARQTPMSIARMFSAFATRVVRQAEASARTGHFRPIIHPESG